MHPYRKVATDLLWLFHQKTILMAVMIGKQYVILMTCADGSFLLGHSRAKSGPKMKRARRKKRPSSGHRLRYPLSQPITLIGLMGAGKTTIGMRLARRLGLTFKDSDAEIELAAGYSVSEIFEKFGEDYFRDGERKVIDRLISGDPMVLATGGGAFMDSETRKTVQEKSISIWLKADINVLVERTSRRDTRPLLRNGDPGQILRDLAQKRYPVYGQADITVESAGGPHGDVVNAIIHKLNAYLAEKADKKPADSGPKDAKRNRRYPPQARNQNRNQAQNMNRNANRRRKPKSA